MNLSQKISLAFECMDTDSRNSIIFGSIDCRMNIYPYWLT
jgi:hypothetical protein